MMMTMRTADGAAMRPSAPPPGQHSSPPFSVRVLCILWPAFLMAGVAEMLVFVVVDPAALLWFGSTPLGWSATAVYSVTFLLLWGVVSTASAMTQLLVGGMVGERP